MDNFLRIGRIVTIRDRAGEAARIGGRLRPIPDCWCAKIHRLVYDRLTGEANLSTLSQHGTCCAR